MIRLANHQGLLSQKELNRFQYFAAQYLLRMNRRVEVRDIEDTLQRQTWYLFPDRYDALFLEGLVGEHEEVLHEEEPKEEVVKNIDEIDRYFEQLDEKRSLTGGQVFALIDGDEQGWV